MSWRPPVYTLVIVLLIAGAALEIREGAALGQPALLALLLLIAALLGAAGGWVAARRTDEAGEADAVDVAFTELDEMRTHIADLQERLDFSERLLAQSAEQRPVPAARGPETLG